MNRCFFFEFAGMPKSGKTTVFDVVTHYLKRHGFKVEEYHGGGRYAPIDKSSIENLNTYLACKAVEFILSSYEQGNSNNKFKIFMMDRGIFDRSIFTKALLRRNQISAEDAQAIDSFISMYNLRNIIDGTFLFITNPRLSIERENINKLTVKDGRVMNTAFLKTLREVSTEEYEKCATSKKNLFLVDTEILNNNVLFTAQSVVNNINLIINE